MGHIKGFAWVPAAMLAGGVMMAAVGGVRAETQSTQLQQNDTGLSDEEVASRTRARRMLGSLDGRPNIIVILTDDMGFSDIGCYGGEIETPNLDRLASEGVRFSQFYNTARCCPSRAALLTGNYSHQAGVGHMLRETAYPGYSDHLSTDTMTMAEVLSQNGYRTYMTGKWHVARSIAADGNKEHWPMQRGFQKYYGIITGASSYYDPATLCRGNNFITVENDPEYKPEKYYFTDAIADNSIKFIDEHEKESPEKPFFMYVAFTAAHWPLHAPEDEIAKNKGKYDAGYDVIRRARFEKMKKLGIVKDDVPFTESVGDWDKVENKAWEARTMETYAAMVHRMDTGVGRIVEKLKSDGLLDNTLIMYMQDNGGCAETIGRENTAKYADYKPMGPNDLQKKIWPPMQTRDGRPVKTGTDVMAGGPDTYNSYGENWANVSNTPFRLYKHWSHEGGISTPLIVHWNEGVAPEMINKIVREPSHLIDVMATALDVSQTSYPSTYKGHEVVPPSGKSLVPLVQDKAFDRGEPIFFEHEDNRAVRAGKWKIVTNGDKPWELYDMETDRSETRDLAKQKPEIVADLSAKWDAWAKKNDVLPLGGWRESDQAEPDSASDDADDKPTTGGKWELKAGDTISGLDRPLIHHREIYVNARVAEWGEGVIVSEGGSQQGFTLYAESSKAVFAVRSNGKLTSVSTETHLAPGQATTLTARLRQNGRLSLRIDKTKAVQAPGNVIASTPVEGLVVGDDLQGMVADYDGPVKFAGKIESVKLQTSDEGKPLDGPRMQDGKKKKGKRKNR